MSLTIGMAVEGTQPVELAAHTRVDLDDDGYYWFLYPLFERLASETGQMVDLYDGATFAGPSLVAFRRVVADARRLIAPMPEQWDVQTGMDIGSYAQPIPPTPVYATVRKDRFLGLLRRLDELLDEAVRLGGRVVCLGD